MPLFSTWTPGLSLFAASQHYIANATVVAGRDHATSRALFFNPLVAHDGTVMLVGGSYEDELERTPDGWRITARVQRVAWTHGVPAADVPSA